MPLLFRTDLPLQTVMCSVLEQKVVVTVLCKVICAGRYVVCKACAVSGNCSCILHVQNCTHEKFRPD